VSDRDRPCDAVKRVFDIVLSGAGLVVTLLPIQILTAGAVLASVGRPVLFRSVHRNTRSLDAGPGCRSLVTESPCSVSRISSRYPNQFSLVVGVAAVEEILQIGSRSRGRREARTYTKGDVHATG
jgi:hypothetical protein